MGTIFVQFQAKKKNKLIRFSISTNDFYLNEFKKGMTYCIKYFVPFLWVGGSDDDDDGKKPIFI